MMAEIFLLYYTTEIFWKEMLITTVVDDIKDDNEYV